MNLKLLISLLGTLSCLFIGQAQFVFSGELQENSDFKRAYLSLVEDYRKVSGIYEGQIISSTVIEDNSFQFTGSNLDNQNRIYRIHIDNCNDETASAHFNGQCNSSQSILFIANNKDTIHFPLSFEDQSLCSIESKRLGTKVLSKVDSLRELMTYDYLSYRSEANKAINNKNWFDKLQQFGKTLDEPLAELYIYEFLSDRSNQFYDYYLEDLRTNSYYDGLLERLNTNYDDAPFTKQYEIEIASDKYRTNYNDGIYMVRWQYILLTLIALIIVFAWLWLKTKQQKKEPFSVEVDTSSLTKQEQKVLDLILENKTNKEIAQEIFISLSTVKTHVNNLYKKLGISSREEVKSLFNR